jgi:NADH:ubiquinone oxidoreductase subunit 5 (subunit L)/multisubunit Na+/H+ antiporter MnhA subunit
LALGWWVYQGFKAGQTDPVQKSLPSGLYNALKNKWYFDELYEATIVRFAWWMASVFTLVMDRNVIDGILHFFARTTGVIGTFLRERIDKRIINGAPDMAAEIIKTDVAPSFRTIQTGRVQQYMIVALVATVAFSVAFALVQYLKGQGLP